MNGKLYEGLGLVDPDGAEQDERGGEV